MYTLREMRKDRRGPKHPRRRTPNASPSGEVVAWLSLERQKPALITIHNKTFLHSCMNSERSCPVSELPTRLGFTLPRLLTQSGRQLNKRQPCTYMRVLKQHSQKTYNVPYRSRAVAG